MEKMNGEIGPIGIPPIEEKTEYEKEYRKLIKFSDNFENLYKIIRRIGIIPGTAKDYPSEKLVADINEVRRGEKDLGFITRTYGLRDKVKELLLKYTHN